jgi:hypothetical protein
VSVTYSTKHIISLAVLLAYEWPRSEWHLNDFRDPLGELGFLHLLEKGVDHHIGHLLAEMLSMRVVRPLLVVVHAPILRGFELYQSGCDLERFGYFDVPRPLLLGGIGVINDNRFPAS